MSVVHETYQKSNCLVWVAVILSILPVSSLTTAEGVQNAALFYYEALIQCPEFETFPSDVTGKVLRGERLSGQLERHVKENRAVIDLVAEGTRVRQCDWQIPFPYTSHLQHSMLRRSRTILFLVAADAQIMQADRDYRRAFERLLTLRQFAAHAAGDPNVGFPLPNMLEGKAVEFVHRMLEVISPEEDTLIWLRQELAFDALPSRWLLRLNRWDFEQTLHVLRLDSEALTRKRTLVTTWSDLSDDELIALIRQPYARFLDRVEETLRATMPYREKRAAIESLVAELRKEKRDDPAMIWHKHADAILDRYDILARRRATLNMVRSAIEICRVMAATGQLPGVLPGGLPQDPYSNEAFEYEITSSGFVLRCRFKPADSREVFKLEFALPR